MPRTVDIGDAKEKFSQLIALAEAGEDVIVARQGVPIARIVPVAMPISETIALMRKERAQRTRVAAVDILPTRSKAAPDPSVP